MKGFHVLPVYGGQSYTPQLQSLRRGVHVVVATPGRAMDHIKRGTLDLSSLRHVVLDEADEMLRMGFIDDVEWILEQTPAERQIALFSATMPPQVRRIAQRHLREPAEVTIRSKTTTASQIRQRYWIVSGMHKLDALTRILEAEPFDAMIVFARTKIATEELAERLAARGFAVEALNGDIVQAQRERTVARLKSGQIDIVVATDVAARGLDVERVSHVVNFDVPYDPESYVHRIGRTGRAGRSGDAILFIAPRERNMLRVIERATRQNIESMQLPSIEDVNERRVARFNEKLTTAIESGAGQMFLPLIENYERDHNVSAAEIAAALASIAQGATPLLLEPSRSPASPYGAAQESSDRGDERPGRGKPRQRDWSSADKPARRERPARADRAPLERDTPAQPETVAPSAQSKLLNRRERRALEHARRESDGQPHGVAVHERGQVQEGADDMGVQERAVQERAPKRVGVQKGGALQKGGARSDRPAKAEPHAPRSERPPGGDEDVETYRIEVGHAHGVKPNNIVGAIANEAGIEGRHIGRVVIRDDHSFVDLPSGMPKEMFRQLQKVRVAGQPLQISRALKSHVEKLRRERPPTAKFKGKPQRGAQRGRK
jgi:ATP-dependent RNA helicase DeaD